MIRWSWFLVISWSFLASSVSADTARKDVRYVSVSDTRLLARASAFAPTVARLKAGSAVAVTAKSAAYLKVTAGGKTGWIPLRAVRTTRPRIGYSATKGSDATSEEVAAATKGFNSEIEGQHKKDNPQLDYVRLDKLEARTLVTA